MGYYDVARPQSDTGIRRHGYELAAAVVFLLAVVVQVHGALVTVPVEIDGVEHRVTLSTPVTELVEEGLVASSSGDLVAVTDGRVLEDGAGEGPDLIVDGRPVQEGETIQAPIEVVSVPGDDVVEEIVTVEEPIAIPVLYQGEGILVSLTNPGSVGRRLVSRGAVSDQVVEMEILDEPVPMRLTRERPSVDDKIVALTFDDGPWPEQTEAILGILEKKDVRATFFMLGLQVKRHPGLARAVRDGGHVIGNHTYGHTILRRSTKKEVRAELDPCTRVIRSATGVTPVWFRPPGGLASPSVHAVCAEKGLRAVGWTVDPQDWAGKDADALVKEVLAAVEPGAVVLLHDGGGDRAETIAALPRIIDGLRARGYDFVTLDDVPDLALRGYGG